MYNYPKKLNVYNKIRRINKENNNEDRIPYNAYRSPSPLNELCDYICYWEKHNIVWDKKVINNGHLLVNRDLDLSNKHIIKKIKYIYDQFKFDLKNLLDEKKEDDNKEFDILFDKYKNKLNEINLDRELLANYCIKVAYRSISEDKVLCWSLFSDIMLKNLKNNSPDKKQCKIEEVQEVDNDTYEFLGKYYKLIEI
ncbi:MAG: hypothetical protein LLF98_02225 [Clostridium sp.]|uniref:hypothetical protein n=1 Tax=Clostridium sp. TaxID=1506 RepID=UPI0025C4E42F|nr:hypothetical protein [Clostridium sp.]MCE5220098.1 hypothetical protein [Clostridium sp.]